MHRKVYACVRADGHHSPDEEQTDIDKKPAKKPADKESNLKTPQKFFYHAPALQPDYQFCEVPQPGVGVGREFGSLLVSILYHIMLTLVQDLLVR